MHSPQTKKVEEGIVRDFKEIKFLKKKIKLLISLYNTSGKVVISRILLCQFVQIFMFNLKVVSTRYDTTIVRLETTSAYLRHHLFNYNLHANF